MSSTEVSGAKLETKNIFIARVIDKGFVDIWFCGYMCDKVVSSMGALEYVGLDLFLIRKGTDELTSLAELI